MNKKLNVFSLTVLLTAVLVSCLPSLHRKTEDLSPVLKKETMMIPNELYFAKLKPYLDKGYTVRMRPKGTSMLPTINDKTDIVRLSRRDSLQVWDVLLAEIEPGRYVLHRLMRISGDTLILKGDHNHTFECALRGQVRATLTALEHHVLDNEDSPVRVEVDDSVIYSLNPEISIDSMPGVRFVVDHYHKLVDMERAINLNESAEVLWHRIESGHFTVADLAAALMEVYDVNDSTAITDCREMLSVWLRYDLVRPSHSAPHAIRP